MHAANRSLGGPIDEVFHRDQPFQADPQLVESIREHRVQYYVNFVMLSEANELAQKRSEEHTSEHQSLMRNSYAVFCLKKNKRSSLYKLNTLTTATLLTIIRMKVVKR